MTNQTSASRKASFCKFTEAAIAELGILTMTILVYEISKAILYRISPKLYQNLAPLRKILSLRSRRHHTKVEG